ISFEMLFWSCVIYYSCYFLLLSWLLSYHNLMPLLIKVDVIGGIAVLLILEATLAAILGIVLSVLTIITAKLVSPYLVLAHLVLAHLVLAHLVLAHLVLAHLVLAHLVLAHLVLAHLVLAHLV